MTLSEWRPDMCFLILLPIRVFPEPDNPLIQKTIPLFLLSVIVRTNYFYDMFIIKFH